MYKMEKECISLPTELSMLTINYFQKARPEYAAKMF